MKRANNEYYQSEKEIVDAICPQIRKTCGKTEITDAQSWRNRCLKIIRPALNNIIDKHFWPVKDRLYKSCDINPDEAKQELSVPDKLNRRVLKLIKRRRKKAMAMSAGRLAKAFNKILKMEDLCLLPNASGVEMNRYEKDALLHSQSLIAQKKHPLELDLLTINKAILHAIYPRTLGENRRPSTLWESKRNSISWIMKLVWSKCRRGLSAAQQHISRFYLYYLFSSRELLGGDTFKIELKKQNTRRNVTDLARVSDAGLDLWLELIGKIYSGKYRSVPLILKKRLIAAKKRNAPEDRLNILRKKIETAEWMENAALIAVALAWEGIHYKDIKKLQPECFDVDKNLVFLKTGNSYRVYSISRESWAFISPRLCKLKSWFKKSELSGAQSGKTLKAAAAKTEYGSYFRGVENAIRNILRSTARRFALKIGRASVKNLRETGTLYKIIAGGIAPRSIASVCGPDITTNVHAPGHFYADCPTLNKAKGEKSPERCVTDEPRDKKLYFDLSLKRLGEGADILKDYVKAETDHLKSRGKIIDDVSERLAEVKSRPGGEAVAGWLSHLIHRKNKKKQYLSPLTVMTYFTCIEDLIAHNVINGDAALTEEYLETYLKSHEQNDPDGETRPINYQTFKTTRTAVDSFFGYLNVFAPYEAGDIDVAAAKKEFAKPVGIKGLILEKAGIIRQIAGKGRRISKLTKRRRKKAMDMSAGRLAKAFNKIAQSTELRSRADTALKSRSSIGKLLKAAKKEKNGGYCLRALNKAILFRICPKTLRKASRKAEPIKWHKFKKYYHRSCRLIVIPDTSAVERKCDELMASPVAHERLAALAAAMAFWMGLRKSEIYGLETQRVRFIGEGEDYVEVLGKGNKYRRGPLKLLPASYLKLLETFYHRALRQNSRHIFDPSKEGKYDYLFRKYFIATKIATSGMHSLRHAFATYHNLKDDLSPVTLAAMLGHESLQVTHCVYDQSSRELLVKTGSPKIINDPLISAATAHKAMGLTPAGFYKKTGGLTKITKSVRDKRLGRGRPCKKYFVYDDVIDVFCGEGAKQTNRITPLSRGARLWHAYYRKWPRRKKQKPVREQGKEASQ